MLEIVNFSLAPVQTEPLIKNQMKKVFIVNEMTCFSHSLVSKPNRLKLVRTFLISGSNLFVDTCGFCVCMLFCSNANLSDLKCIWSPLITLAWQLLCALFYPFEIVNVCVSVLFCRINESHWWITSVLLCNPIKVHLIFWWHLRFSVAHLFARSLHFVLTGSHLFSVIAHTQSVSERERETANGT